MGIDIEDIQSLLSQDTHENAYDGFNGQKKNMLVCPSCSKERNL